MRRFDLWSYSSLQCIADASIALRLLRSSFAIFARLNGNHRAVLQLVHPHRGLLVLPSVCHVWFHFRHVALWINVYVNVRRRKAERHAASPACAGMQRAADRCVQHCAPCAPVPCPLSGLGGRFSARRRACSLNTVYVGERWHKHDWGLYVDTRPHHFAVEHGVFLVFHQYWLNESADFANVARNIGPLLPRVSDFASGNNDGDINIAVGIGIALGIRAIHDDFRLGLVAQANHLLVASHGVEGFFSGKRSSIHCVSSFVVVMMCSQISFVSDRAAATFCSG